MGSGRFFSGESRNTHSSPYCTPNGYLTAPIEHHSNDNEDRHRQKNRPRAKTTARKNVAARILESFRKLESIAGNDQVHVFTLRIHPALLEGRKNPSVWMQQRIARELQNRLGRDVPFAGTLEWRRKEGHPELHCHGAITLARHEKRRASAALRAAGGPWRGGRANGVQAEIKLPDPNKSFRRAYGLQGWANYCADDSRQTQLELDRRRQALDPQQQHHRAPNIIMRSGLQNSRRVSKQTDESVSKQITPGVSKQLDNKAVSKPSPVIVSKQANREEPVAKSMAERMKDHHAKRKREWAELQAERDALREEVDDLRRQLAEREDISAAAAPGVTTIEVKDAKIAQAIAGLMEKRQLVNVINAGIRSVKAASAPAPESEKITTPEVADRTARSIIEEVYNDYVEEWDDECDDNEREALRAARDEMLAEGLYQDTADGIKFLYDKHLKRIKAEVKKTEADAKKTEAKAKRLAAIAERQAKAASAAASAAVAERRLKAKAKDEIIAKALDDAERATFDAELEPADFPMPEIPEVVETPIVEKIEEGQ